MMSKKWSGTLGMIGRPGGERRVRICAGARGLNQASGVAAARSAAECAVVITSSLFEGMRGNGLREPNHAIICVFRRAKSVTASMQVRKSRENESAELRIRYAFPAFGCPWRQRSAREGNHGFASCATNCCAFDIRVSWQVEAVPGHAPPARCTEL